MRVYTCVLILLSVVSVYGVNPTCSEIRQAIEDAHLCCDEDNIVPQFVKQECWDASKQLPRCEANNAMLLKINNVWHCAEIRDVPTTVTWSRQMVLSQSLEGTDLTYSVSLKSI